MNAATRAVMLRMVNFLECSGVRCSDMHHSKKDQHDYGEPCPVVARSESAIAEARALLEEPASEDAAKEGFVLVPVEPLKTLIQDYVRATSPEYLMPPPWLIQVRASIKKTKESGK